MRTKIVILLALVALARNGSAQSFATYTNLQLDSTTIAASTTAAWGTNTLDVSRYNSVILTASGQGSGYSTNTVAFTFLDSCDNTNWGTVPRFALSITAYGTNAWAASSNLDVRGIGYLKAYQVISAATNSQTNAVLQVRVKNYPRN